MIFSHFLDSVPSILAFVCVSLGKSLFISGSQFVHHRMGRLDYVPCNLFQLGYSLASSEYRAEYGPARSDDIVDKHTDSKAKLLVQIPAPTFTCCVALLHGLIPLCLSFLICTAGIISSTYLR